MALGQESETIDENQPITIAVERARAVSFGIDR